jgi:hypothetical protein
MSATLGIVAFSPTAFKAAFPAFATIPDVALEMNFGFAELQINNTYCSVVCDVGTRANLLNLVTAHITALLNGVNGQAPTGLVGRVSGATQGSVSVQTDFKAESEAASYFAQTPWGALFWQLSVRYRTARYIAPCNERFGNSWESWPE